MINKDYLYSNTYHSTDSVCIEDNSVYFYKHSIEDRSFSVDALKKRFSGNTIFVGIENAQNCNDCILDSADNMEYHLRSSVQIKALLTKHQASVAYIDVSGLNIRACASIVKNILSLDPAYFKKIFIVYTEPEYYNVEEFKTRGVYFDLSEEIEGISPLPGFERIIPDEDKEVFLVPLLGFEGGRFAHILENIPPLGENIFPVVGLAGFRPEYPFVTYWGNHRPLINSCAWEHVMFATANSMIDAFTVLDKIVQKHPTGMFKIAPIGTKPHTLAAILFAICHPNNVELIYDNPIRKKKRTSGVGKIVISSILELVSDANAH